jgi:hypothetical protein
VLDALFNKGEIVKTLSENPLVWVSWSYLIWALPAILLLSAILLKEGVSTIRWKVPSFHLYSDLPFIKTGATRKF